MRRIATIVGIVGGNDNIKEIEVSRETACEGCSQGADGSCHACIMLGENKKMRTRARDPIGAGLGDCVWVETPSNTVIRYAAEVFLLPLVLGAVGYLIGEKLGAALSPLICSLVGFAAAFVYVKFIPAKRAENRCEVVIVGIEKVSDSPC